MTKYNPHDLIPLIKKMINDGQLCKTLFTYMPVEQMEERVKPIFTDFTLWFSSPIYFNDPFDCKIYPHIPNTDELAEYLATHAENATPDDYEIIHEGISKNQAIVKQAIDDVINRCGIKCFTHDNSNILMWSHYTNSHKGICLEFDVSLNPEFFIYPINVAYSDDYPKLEFTDKTFTTEVLRTKAKVWEYEREVRIYKPTSGYYSFDPIALRSITFGCNISLENKTTIIKMVKQNQYLDHVCFFQCQPNSTQFKLDINNLKTIITT